MPRRALQVLSIGLFARTGTEKGRARSGRPLPAPRPLPGQRPPPCPGCPPLGRAATPALPAVLPGLHPASLPGEGSASQRRSPHWTGSRAPLLGRSSGLDCTAYGSSAPSALNPWPSAVRGPPSCQKKVTNPQGDGALEEQRFVSRSLSTDKTRPPRDIRCSLRLLPTFSGRGNT